VFLAVFAADQTSWVDVPPRASTVYTYCLSAVSLADDEVFQTGCDAGSTTLWGPLDVAATDEAFDDRVRITWRDRSSVETGFGVYRRELPDGEEIELVITEPDREIWEDTEAEPGVAYEYCVSTIGQDGLRISSVCDLGSRAYLVSPTALSASDGLFTDHVELTWSYPAETGAEGFRVDKDGALVTVLPADVRSWDDVTGIGSVAEYCVRAFEEIEIEGTPTEVESGPAHPLRCRSGSACPGYWLPNPPPNPH